MSTDLRLKMKKRLAQKVLRYKWVHEVLLSVYTLDEKMKLKDFCRKFSLSPLKVLSVLRVVDHLYGHSLLSKNQVVMVDAGKKVTRTLEVFPLKNFEQNGEVEKIIFHFFSKIKDESFFKKIENKMSALLMKKKIRMGQTKSNKNKVMQAKFLKNIQHSNNNPIPESRVKINEEKIIQAISAGEVLKLHFINSYNQVACLPHKILVIENKKILIAEELGDRCLSYFELQNIGVVELDWPAKADGYQSNFSNLHIKEFIEIFRSIGQEEIRVIVKFTSLEKVTFFDMAPHIKHPYLTMNGRGEFIWAATIFEMAPLFDWLAQIGPDAEILDPEEVRKNYHGFIQKKLGKAA